MSVGRIGGVPVLDEPGLVEVPLLPVPVSVDDGA